MHDTKTNSAIIARTAILMRRLNRMRYLVWFSIVMMLSGVVALLYHLAVGLPSPYAGVALFGAILSYISWVEARSLRKKAWMEFLRSCEKMVDDMTDPYHDEDGD